MIMVVTSLVSFLLANDSAPQGSAEIPRLTLAARKHISKKDVQTIEHCKAATLVAVLSDGLLTLLDAELLDAHLLPGIKVRKMV